MPFKSPKMSIEGRELFLVDANKRRDEWLTRQAERVYGRRRRRRDAESNHAYNSDGFTAFVIIPVILKSPGLRIRNL